MSELESKGLTRREMLRRGVVTGGAALAWATPVVTTIGLNSAMASTTSPVVTTTTTTPGDISYIAIMFNCGSGTQYSKYDGTWSGGAGQVESQCPGISTANGTTSHSFVANLSTGCITVPAGCTLLAAAAKGGSDCNVDTGLNVVGPATYCIS